MQLKKKGIAPAAWDLLDLQFRARLPHGHNLRSAIVGHRRWPRRCGTVSPPKQYYHPAAPGARRKNPRRRINAARRAGVRQLSGVNPNNNNNNNTRRVAKEFRQELLPDDRCLS